MKVVSLITILVALSISAVAALYSIIGLTAIFPASVLAVIVMGTVLEIGKITTAIWLHTFWEHCRWWLKTYLVSALLILMFITSLGIFGFLSRAHIEHTASLSGNEFVIENIDQRIQRQERIIRDSENVIAQLDEAVNVLAEAQRIRGPEGAIATRERQSEERESLNQIVNQAFNEIQELSLQRTQLQIDQSKVESEVGPIRYIAELIYGENPDKATLESAVRFLIIIIVLVFDPLAVCLILAAITGLKISNKNKINNTINTENIDKLNEPVIDTKKEIKNKEPRPNSSSWLGQK